MSPTPSSASAAPESSDTSHTQDFQRKSLAPAIIFVVIAFLFIILAIALSVFFYIRRRNDRDRLIMRASSRKRKLLPAWLSLWTGELGFARSHASTDKVDAISDEHSDAIALEPVPISLPPPAYNTYDKRSKPRPPTLVIPR